jgi:hypothetical protein
MLCSSLQLLVSYCGARGEDAENQHTKKPVSLSYTPYSFINRSIFIILYYFYLLIASRKNSGGADRALFTFDLSAGT